MARSVLVRIRMTKPVPAVRKYMTSSPWTVSPHAPLADAHELMHEKHIRHLPVVEKGHIVGVVSDGDLYRAEAIRGADPRRIQIRDVMVPRPYCVSPDAPVDEVVQEMAAHRFGSAVVCDGPVVIGIFTSTDALEAFAELLGTRLRPRGQRAFEGDGHVTHH